jgi:hypothetical protein
VVRRPKRTGALPVKLPHPVTAFILAAAVAVFYYGALAWGFSVDTGRGSHAWRVVVDVGAPVAAVVGVVLVLSLLHRAVQAWNAAGPAGVDITVFPAAAPSEVQSDQISAELRRALTEVYLSGPSVVPGESARQDFLTDVRGVVEHARTPWGALVAALSLLSPRNVYRVFCTVQRDGTTGEHALTVEVSGLPRQEVSVTTIRDETWELIIRRAACHIAAYVLPRTKVSRRAPWTPWHGINLSPELFFHFHEARRLARLGRLEEALHHFNESIALDPLNAYIRIEKATVQDELGLFVDALGSYVDVVTIEGWHDRPVWRRYRAILGDRRYDERHVFPGSPNGPAALQLARYRMVASLAAGYRLATQWHNNTAPTGEEVRQAARHREANQVMRRLRLLIGPYAQLMLDAHGVPEGTHQAVLDRLDRDDPEILRRVFQFAALEEAAAIERDYHWSRPRRWRRLPIGQAAIRVMPVWAALQYHYVECAQQGKPDIPQPLRQPLRYPVRYPWLRRAGAHGPGAARRSRGRWLSRADTDIGWVPRQGRADAAPKLAWPPDPAGLSKLLHAALGRRILFRTFVPKRGWQEHYNAACTFAVGIITPDLPLARCDNPASYRNHERLVQLAIDQLERAAVAADSQFVGQKLVWLRRGDQDLDELRITRLYTTFVERYLPDTGTWALPSNPTRLVVSGHIVRLLKEYAELRESFWREEARQPVVDTAQFADEIAWWRRLREFCADYRDWRTRLELIRHATRFTERTGHFSAAISAEDSWLDGHAWRSSGPTHDGAGRSDPRLRVLRWLDQSELINADADAVVRDRNARLDVLNQRLSEPLIDEALRDALCAASDRAAQDPAGHDLATHLADAWRAVARWAVREGADASAGPWIELTELRQMAAEPNGVARRLGQHRRPERLSRYGGGARR